MRAFLIFLVFLMPLTVSADGATEISGKNKAGRRVVAFPTALDHFTRNPREYSGNDLFNIDVFDGNKKVLELNERKCRYKLNSRNERHEFSCSAGGGHPLSGVTYSIRSDPKECGGWIYTCKAGCGEEAPQRMYQEPWECTP